MIVFVLLLIASTANAQYQSQIVAPQCVDPALVNVPAMPADYDAALRTRGGLDEDYRLAELLIARTRARRAEAARLQAAAAEIELSNARLRNYICSRYCSDVPVPAQPLFNPFSDPSLDRMNLVPVPAMPAPEIDLSVWRGAQFAPAPRRFAIDGSVNVQPLPRAYPVPTYRVR
jgi:hypothetical protein